MGRLARQMGQVARIVDLFMAFEAELPALVTEGHALRFYGVAGRDPLQHHVYIDASSLQRPVAEIVAGAPGLGPLEAGVQRQLEGAEVEEFAVAGSAERLIVTLKSPRLPPFEEAYARRQEGRYLGARLQFLELSDLITSRETSREDDWRIVGLLEEIADEQRLNAAVERSTLVDALTRLRSLRGYQRALALGALSDGDVVDAAIVRARTPMAVAFLAPHAPEGPPKSSPGSGLSASMRQVLEGPLKGQEAGSERHFGLVEAVRRLYRLERMGRAGAAEALAEEG